METRPIPQLDPRTDALLAEIASRDGRPLCRDGRPLDLRDANLSRDRLAPLADGSGWWDAERRG